MSGSVDARTIQTLARDLWVGLTLAQRAALRRAHKQPGGYRLDSATRKRTRAAMQCKELLTDDDRELAPLGILVRWEGLEADAADARRRHSRRKVQP